MTQQVKNRIEQIRRGEVPEGYKKTKVGLVPTEWDAFRLSEISTELHDVAGDEDFETLSISAGIGFVNQSRKFGKEISGKQYQKYTVLQRGDFSYNKGNSTKYPPGCIYQWKDRETAAVPNVFESFRLISGNNDFFEQLFKKGSLNKQLYALINHGVRDDGLLNLRGEDFYSCSVVFPPLSEQEKIAEILETQDRVIALCEKKVEELKKLKKACLQNMFPKPGHTVPDWRFPEFTAPWEQRKLGDVLVVYNETCENDGTFEHVSLTTEGVVPKTKRYDRDQLVKHDDKKYRVTRADDICYNPANLKFGVICRNKYGDGIFSPIYVTFKVKDSQLPSFIEMVVTRYDFIEKALQYQQGTVYERMAVDPDTLLRMVVSLPGVQEQKTIGAFFESIDNLISLHQRKCDEEKQKKKALMQLLLTGIVRVKV